MLQISNSDVAALVRILHEYGNDKTDGDTLRVVNMRRRARLLYKKLVKNHAVQSK